MIALIDEESANQSDSGSNSKKSNIRLSEHYVTLGSPDILTGNSSVVRIAAREMLHEILHKA